MKPGYLLIGVMLVAAACNFTLGGELLEERTETHFLPSGGRLVVENLNGNVSIEPWSGAEIVVTMAISGNKTRGIPDGFAIETTSDASSLVYSVKYPPGTSNMSVNFTIRVPEGLSLETCVVLTNGVVSVTGPHTVSLETTNGSILIDGAVGGSGAEAVNGSITATLGGIGSGMAFTTVNGSIHAYLSAEAGISAETVNGSVSVSGFTAESSSRSSAVVQGGTRLELNTVNGNITVEAR